MENITKSARHFINCFGEFSQDAINKVRNGALYHPSQEELFREVEAMLHTPKLEPHEYFYAVDGQVFKTRHEMLIGFMKMSKETVEYHYDEYKDDLRNWLDFIDSKR